MTDNVLLYYYYLGFDNELTGEIDLRVKAYKMGELDAELELSSSDSQTDEEIVKRIRNENYTKRIKGNR